MKKSFLTLLEVENNAVLQFNVLVSQKELFQSELERKVDDLDDFETQRNSTLRRLIADTDAKILAAQGQLGKTRYELMEYMRRLLSEEYHSQYVDMVWGE